MKARNNARDAHLVLVNHSLLFSDLAADNAILSDYVNVIFDEAHNIEKTATDYLGVETTLWQFRDFLNKLYSKEKFETGVLVQLNRRIQSGKLKQPHLDSLIRRIDELIEKVPNCWQLVQFFFRELTRILKDRVPQDNKYFASRHRYTRQDHLFETLLSQFAEINTALNKIRSDLNNLIEYFSEIPEESFEYQRQLYQDLKAQLSQSTMLGENLKFLVDAEWDNYVYWYELPRREDSDDTCLYSAPLNIGGMLTEKLYSKLNGAIFTSATLAVNQKFDYFIKRIGVEQLPAERVNSLMLDSPFDYSKQCSLTVPTFFPDVNSPDYLFELKKLMKNLAVKLPRGTLALFTAYSSLNNVYDDIRPTFEMENVPLLGQGKDGGRHVIMNRFKKAENSFLLGTDSFWEGVDVPGKALEIVVITKLPFDVPSEPVIQAKSELIKKQGGNPFMEYSIPEAVIRFRQGFGRLIRSHSDYGVVIVLDNRVIKKLYGRIFLQSLPLQATFLPNEDEFWQKVAELVFINNANYVLDGF